MSQTQQQQGTTQAILAPYLAAEPPIKVQVNYSDGHRIEEAELIGLAVSARIRFADGFTQWADMWRITPVLRPFSALTEPLEDGTVPAVEVAKIVAGTTSTWRIELVGGRRVVVQDESGYQVIIKDMISPRIGWSIEAYSGRTLAALLDVLAAYDYLRSNHFALPVNGRPLIEGVDFIPKTSSAAPIDKNTAL